MDGNIITTSKDFNKQLHRKYIDDKFNKLLNQTYKIKPEPVLVDNYDDDTMQNILNKLGDALAEYFSNTTRLSTGEEDIREGFYIGNDPTECSFILVAVWKKGLSVEKLGAAQNYLPIRIFINEFCEPKMIHVLERILFEHC